LGGGGSLFILTGLLKYLPKNMTILVQKLGGGKKLSKSVSEPTISDILNPIFYISQTPFVKNNVS
jgi:hypothetical protein